MAGDEPPIPLITPIEALRYFRAKGFAFGFAWQDVWQEEHVQAFTVAKAMKLQILELIRAAVDRAIAEGQTLAMFREGLQPLLEAEGWWGRKRMIDPLTAENRVVQLGSPRRLKTIYRVNMRTAQAAGRWERIQRSKKLFPLLEYSAILDGRERPEHHAWHGTILPVDHPWWDTHYPPCGWGCRCTVKPRNQRMMDARGLKQTIRPVSFPLRDYTNKRTGEVSRVEQGIDPGWSYNVGKAALSGTTPTPIGPDAEIAAAARSAPEIDPDVGAFFAVFGLAGRADLAKGMIFTDAGGWPVPIALDMMMAAGAQRLAIDVERRRYLVAVAAAIAAPIEIRWRWVAGRDGLPLLMRRYIGAGAIVDIGRAGWRFFAAGEQGFDRARLARGETAWARSSPAVADIAAAFDRHQARDANGRWTSRHALAAAFVESVWSGAETPPAHRIGPVADHVQARLAKLGLRSDTKSVELGAGEIRHIRKRHGSDGRNRKATRSIDIARASDILHKGDINHGTPQVARNGSRRISVKAEVGGERYTAAFEIHKHRIRLHTLVRN